MPIHLNGSDSFKTREHWLCQRSGEIALFEIGFSSVKGCDHVLNQETGQVEEIFAIDIRHSQNSQCTTVETFSGRWYVADGSAIFAKRVCTQRRALPLS